MTGANIHSELRQRIDDLDAEQLTVRDTAQHLRGRPIVPELAMVLDEWAGLRKRLKGDQT